MHAWGMLSTLKEVSPDGIEGAGITFTTVFINVISIHHLEFPYLVGADCAAWLGCSRTVRRVFWALMSGACSWWMLSTLKEVSPDGVEGAVFIVGAVRLSLPLSPSSTQSAKGNDVELV
jgi:hypothetical protein